MRVEQKSDRGWRVQGAGIFLFFFILLSPLLRVILNSLSISIGIVTATVSCYRQHKPGKRASGLKVATNYQHSFLFQLSRSALKAFWGTLAENAIDCLRLWRQLSDTAESKFRILGLFDSSPVTCGIQKFSIGLDSSHPLHCGLYQDCAFLTRFCVWWKNQRCYLSLIDPFFSFLFCFLPRVCDDRSGSVNKDSISSIRYWCSIGQ